MLSYNTWKSETFRYQRQIERNFIVLEHSTTLQIPANWVDAQIVTAEKARAF